MGFVAGGVLAVAIEGARELYGLLKSYSIAHVFEVYDGDRVNRVQQRITSKLVPFFAAHLKH